VTENMYKTKSIDFLDLSGLAPCLPRTKVSKHWASLGCSCQKGSIGNKSANNVWVDV